MILVTRKRCVCLLVVRVEFGAIWSIYGGNGYVGEGEGKRSLVERLDRYLEGGRGH